MHNMSIQPTLCIRINLTTVIWVTIPEFAGYFLRYIQIIDVILSNLGFLRWSSS